MLMIGILKEADKIGDKVVVFSQSLNILDMIEEVLKDIDAVSRKESKKDSSKKHLRW